MPPVVIELARTLDCTVVQLVMNAMQRSSGPALNTCASSDCSGVAVEESDPDTDSDEPPGLLDEEDDISGGASTHAGGRQDREDSSAPQRPRFLQGVIALCKHAMGGENPRVTEDSMLIMMDRLHATAAEEKWVPLFAGTQLGVCDVSSCGEVIECSSDEIAKRVMAAIVASGEAARRRAAMPAPTTATALRPPPPAATPGAAPSLLQNPSFRTCNLHFQVVTRPVIRPCRSD